MSRHQAAKLLGLHTWVIAAYLRDLRHERTKLHAFFGRCPSRERREEEEKKSETYSESLMNHAYLSEIEYNTKEAWFEI
jgi:hypothetical protein